MASKSLRKDRPFIQRLKLRDDSTEKKDNYLKTVPTELDSIMSVSNSNISPNARQSTALNTGPRFAKHRIKPAGGRLDMVYTAAQNVERRSKFANTTNFMFTSRQSPVTADSQGSPRKGSSRGYNIDQMIQQTRNRQIHTRG